MGKPKVGEVWERDGKCRQVTCVEPYGGDGYHVMWRRPGSGLSGKSWCSTWEAWATKATLVPEVD